MYKYKKPLEEHEIKKLQELSQLDFSTMNETDVREEYITPLLSLLGYKKNSDYEVEREETSELVDMSINIGSKRLKLDYKFNIRKKYFWLIEAKTGKDKEISKENVAQAYLYSLHPDINCRFFAVCNGWFFNLYDRNLGLFKDINTDVFTPILQIEYKDLNEDVFNRLYSFLGSSEIVFKIKEDVLLKDIQNTLESEIYMDRLKEFSKKFDAILNKAEINVRKNIQKSNNWKSELEKSQIYLRDILSGQSLIGVLDTMLNQGMTAWQIDITYEIIKEKLLPFRDITIKYPTGCCRSDVFFNYLFLYPLRPIQVEYIWNVVCLLKYLSEDNKLKGMICSYNGEKIEISELLDRYVLDIFDFFENRKDIRALIIVYPMYYRVIKYSLYYFANPVIKEKFSVLKNYMEKYLSEEELSRQHYFPGHEFMNVAQLAIIPMIQDFINKAFDSSRTISVKPRVWSIGGLVNGEVIKHEILTLDRLITQISQQFDLDKLREQMPMEDGDEMFTFDRYYQNPWTTVFIYTLRCCKGHSLSQKTLNKIKCLVESGFIPISEYASFFLNKDIHLDLYNKTITEDDLLKEFNLSINDKHEEIINNLKLNWE